MNGVQPILRSQPQHAAAPTSNNSSTSGGSSPSRGGISTYCTTTTLHATPMLGVEEPLPPSVTHISWDEEGIREHDKTRGTRMQVYITLYMYMYIVH